MGNPDGGLQFWLASERLLRDRSSTFFSTLGLKSQTWTASGSDALPFLTKSTGSKPSVPSPSQSEHPKLLLFRCQEKLLDLGHVWPWSAEHKENFPIGIFPHWLKNLQIHPPHCPQGVTCSPSYLPLTNPYLEASHFSQKPKLLGMTCWRALSQLSFALSPPALVQGAHTYTYLARITLRLTSTACNVGKHSHVHPSVKAEARMSQAPLRPEGSHLGTMPALTRQVLIKSNSFYGNWKYERKWYCFK